MQLRSVKEAKVNGKRVLVRCGFDVPFNDQGAIEDDERIRDCVQTFKYLLGKNAKLILCAHNGRPHGKRVDKLSMNNVDKKIEELTSRPVIKLDDCVGPQVTAAVSKMKTGEIILLENLRFHEGEDNNDPDFAKQLAGLAEIYVNEAFANCHRHHASMTGVPKYLPAYAGFRLQKEVNTLSQILEKPVRPLVAIIGGAKISDKIQVISKFLELADHVLIGGALANTILKAQGVSIGKSLVDEKMTDIANQLPLTDIKLHVPVDVVIAHSIAKDVPIEHKAVGKVSDDEYILDIGPDTIKLFEMIVKQAKTIVWGGPMGYFEIEAFAKGSYKMAEMICNTKAESVIGGGDTLKVLERVHCKDKVSFISTGGGAMLEFIEKGTLPALQFIKK